MSVTRTPNSLFRCDFMLYKDAAYAFAIGKGRMRSEALSFIDAAADNSTRALNGSLEFIYSIDAPIFRVPANYTDANKMLWMNFGEPFNVVAADVSCIPMIFKYSMVPTSPRLMVSYGVTCWLNAGCWHPRIRAHAGSGRCERQRDAVHRLRLSA